MRPIRAAIFVCLVLLAALMLLPRGAHAPAHPQSPPDPSPRVRCAHVGPLPQEEREGQLSRIVERADGTFVPEHNLPPENPQSRWKNPAKLVEPIFPKHYAAPIRVRSGVAGVACVPVNANSRSTAELAADGSLVYRNAFEGCDVQYRCTPYKTEEFLVIAAPQGWDGRPRPSVTQTGEDARPTLEKRLSDLPLPPCDLDDPSNRKSQIQNRKCFSWDLDCGSATAPLQPRLTPAHTIELCDAAGAPRLRINAPDGKDATGKSLRAGHELALSLDGARLTLTANLDGCAFPVTIDPSWSSTGTMSIPREHHTATLLNSGKVLVGQSTTLTCELFDPNSGTWSATASLAVDHSNGAATLLNDGTVLVAGGSTPTCERYNPNTGVWSITGNLNATRLTNTSILLDDGSIMTVAGVNNSIALNSVEIYEPTTGTWNFTGSIVTPRLQPPIVRLADSRILVAGGFPLFSGGSSESNYFTQNTRTWSLAGGMVTSRSSHTLTALPDGTALVAGGSDSFSFFSSCELFSPTTNTWSLTAPMSVSRGDFATVLLQNGFALAIGGRRLATSLDPDMSCEAYDPVLRTWSVVGNMSIGRRRHTASVLQDGRVLVTGGLENTTLASCEIFDPSPVTQSQSVTIHTGSTSQISLISQTISPRFNYTIIQNPQYGTLAINGITATYAAHNGPSRLDGFQVRVFDGPTAGNVATISITLVNDPPTISGAASPTFLLEGQSVAFASTASDANGDALTYAWNFGDGSASTQQNPSHAYAAAGTYNAIVTVTDIAGATATATVVVNVYRASDRPTARFTTSDVVGFVGQPLTFDAALSTDAQNAIVSYAWNFGDGSPNGAEKVLSKIYNTVGSYTITLTLTDGTGLTDSTARAIEILPAEDVGLFNSFIKYKVRWDRGKEDADSLTLDANMNVGGAAVEPGTAVALEIAGVRFTGTLDAKLRDTSNASQKWQVIANTRKQSAGEVLLKLKLKKASLGLGFNLAGATAGADPSDPVEADIPVRIEIAGRIFEVSIDSVFKFSKDGKKATGEGEGP